MTSFVLLLVGACSPCPTIGPAPDREGWQESVAEVEASFDETGECPQAPPEEAVMSWGCPYEPDVSIFDEASTFILGKVRASLGETFVWMEIVEAEVDGGCNTGTLEAVQASQEDAEQAAEAYFHAGTTTLPQFFGPDVSEAKIIRDGAEYGLSYSWLCLEAAPGPAGDAHYGEPSGEWRGSLFLHIDDDDGRPVDAFVAFDEIDCAFGGEDEGAGSDEYGTWEETCDGIDNDFDGYVDDGAEDADGNGIADCAE